MCDFFETLGWKGLYGVVKIDVDAWTEESSWDDSAISVSGEYLYKVDTAGDLEWKKKN